MIPLVILDLDGTVIGADGQVRSCVWSAADTARKAGVKLAVCTGRPGLGVAKRVAERLGPTTPHIFQSGAHVAYAGGETLQVSALRESTTRLLVEHARDVGLALELYTPTTLFVERTTPMSDAHAKMIGVGPIVRDLVEVLENEPVIRAQWVVAASDVVRAVALELEAVQLSTATSPALPDASFISVTQAGVSKGDAVRFLAQTLRLDLARVMAVGDSDGDAPMLDVVGFPVVMANASSLLLERYARAVPSVEDCGVVDALEQAVAQVA